MNKQQKAFLFILSKNFFMLTTFFFFFWAFIYQFAFWNKPLLLGLMSSAVNMVMFMVSFFLWIAFEMWLKYPELRPTLKIEREGKALLVHDSGREEERKREKEKDESKKLPLY